MPYQQESNSIEIAKNQINVTELLKDIKHQHTCNGESKYSIRRKNTFEDFAVTVQKPWISPCKLINVTFIGEPNVDIGGPRTEFFSSKFVFFGFFSSFKVERYFDSFSSLLSLVCLYV